MRQGSECPNDFEKGVTSYYVPIPVHCTTKSSRGVNFRASAAAGPKAPLSGCSIMKILKLTMLYDDIAIPAAGTCRLKLNTRLWLAFF